MRNEIHSGPKQRKDLEKPTRSSPEKIIARLSEADAIRGTRGSIARHFTR